jgi:diphosphomevalonate decarboxylase
MVHAGPGEVLVKASDWADMGIHVASMNTFPTAAGLASSAAGFAALTFALAKLMCAKEEYEGQLTAIARQGSGSACRSLMGGFVRWEMGKKADATDSIAVQVADESHWPSLRAIILVASATKKHTSSTAGMGTSVATSSLLAHRAAVIVDQNLRAIEAAYLARDFAKFGEITMRDSNQFHAVCLDTYPPIFYMNDVSKGIIRAVHAFNEFHGRVRAAYTFDAGPNAVIFLEEADQLQLLSLILLLYPGKGEEYVSDSALAAAARAHTHKLPKELVAMVEATADRQPGDVKHIYCTRAGDGPRLLRKEDSLLDPVTGLPITIKPKAATAAPVGGWGWYGVAAAAAMAAVVVARSR